MRPKSNPLVSRPLASAAALCALAAFTIAGSASAATLLFSDNFDATSPTNPNDQIGNPGRQGGTLATLGYLMSGNVQMGNATNPANAPDSDPGDDLLVAFGGSSAYVNYNFSGQTTPIEISFRGLVNSASATADDWVSFNIGDNTLDWVTTAAASILFRASGGTEVRDHGSDGVAGGTGTAPGLDAWMDYKVVLSDTAGTGSAWGTGGSRADYYSNGLLLGTLAITQLTADEGYFGFSAGVITGYDDLAISAISATSVIPEPSGALATIGLLLGGMMIRRRA